MSVKFTDNSAQIKAQMAQNKKRALTAMGLVGVEAVLEYMQNEYYKDIHLTGDLKRDVNHHVNEDSVTIGNSLEYAKWVHNGTAQMRARPYIKDAISDNIEMLEEVAAEHLKKGF